MFADVKHGSGVASRTRVVSVPNAIFLESHGEGHARAQAAEEKIKLMFEGLAHQQHGASNSARARQARMAHDEQHERVLSEMSAERSRVHAQLQVTLLDMDNKLHEIEECYSRAQSDNLEGDPAHEAHLQSLLTEYADWEKEAEGLLREQQAYEQAIMELGIDPKGPELQAIHYRSPYDQEL